MNTIDVQNLGMNFGRFPALSNFSLSVPAGTAMALLGENGAGKTTFLRILAGIYEPSAGSGTVQPAGRQFRLARAFPPRKGREQNQ
ncbi:MAG: ATP-binding cassette domain-containing protein [Akkermansiaceae bacterium]